LLSVVKLHQHDCSTLPVSSLFRPDPAEWSKL
jgi:hypothetical protein